MDSHNQQGLSVAIGGAGICGLTASIAMAIHGHHVKVVEQTAKVEAVSHPDIFLSHPNTPIVQTLECRG